MSNKIQYDVNYNEQYWEEYYNKEMIVDESSFCMFVKEKLVTPSLILDIGCGSGRDTFSFYKNGHKVFGIDKSQQAILNNKNLEVEGKLSYICSDVGLKNDFRNLLNSIKKSNNDNLPKVIYSRFFLHSITLQEQNDYLEVISEILDKNDLLCLEFRTIEDKEISKVYDNHYRRFINMEELLVDLQEKYMFEIKYKYKGRNLSVFKQENPYLGRIICSKK